MNKYLRFLLYLLIAIIPLGQLSLLPFPFSPQVHLYLQDIVLTILAISWVLARVVSKKHSVPPVQKPVFIFIGVCFISLLVALFSFSVPEVVISSLYLVRWILYASLYWISFDLLKSKKIQIKTVTLLAFSGIITSLFGLIQYVLYPNLRNLWYLGWDPHEYRVFGTFFDSGFTGIILVITLLLITHLLQQTKHANSSRRLVLAVSWIVTFAAFVLTYSRSSYVAFAVGFILFAFFNRLWKLAVGVIFLLIIALPFLPKPSATSEGVKLGRTSTINARIENYEQTIEIIREHPLIGVGFDTLRFVKRDKGFVPEEEWDTSHSASGADSSLLFVFATTGIIGLFAYCYAGYRLIKESLVRFHPKTEYACLAITTLEMVVAHSLFLNSLFYPWVLVYMWILFGIAHVSINAR